MNEFKRSPHQSIIDEAIERKGPDYSDASKQTFKSDSMAILESLMAEVDEELISESLRRQGFRESSSYLTTFRSLANVARERRPK